MNPMQSFRTAMAGLLMLVMGAGTIAHADEALDEALAVLKQDGLASDAPSLIKHLEQSLPNAQTQTQIAALIQQLGDASFEKRETAGKKLIALGPLARAALEKATKAADPEVSWRSGKLLVELDSGAEGAKQSAQLRAVLVVLKQRPAPQAVPVLLSLLESTSDRSAQDAATEALWASVNPSHAALLQEWSAKEKSAAQAAAIVGWELAAGDEATEKLTALLTSDQPHVVLAACRALIDRRPRLVARVLQRILASDDPEIQAQADSLLQSVTKVQLEPTSDTSLASAWEIWLDKNLDKAEMQPLGAARLNLTDSRGRFAESFALDAADAAKGYGRMEYESSLPAKWQVSKGKLQLDGQHEEGDQRLFLSAKKMTGREEFPASFEVRTKLGGQADNNFGWHVGVSIGKVKLLFHPDLEGGEFRAEDVATHEYIFTNEQMGYTPKADVLHEMTVRVKRDTRQTEFEVTVSEAAPGKGKFTKTFAVPNDEVGVLNRIGLERSGRTGGAALFDDFSIRALR